MLRRQIHFVVGFMVLFGSVSVGLLKSGRAEEWKAVAECENGRIVLDKSMEVTPYFSSHYQLVFKGVSLDDDFARAVNYLRESGALKVVPNGKDEIIVKGLMADVEFFKHTLHNLSSPAPYSDPAYAVDLDADRSLLKFSGYERRQNEKGIDSPELYQVLGDFTFQGCKALKFRPIEK